MNNLTVKRREAKSKGEKERYTHLNAEFQRIARRHKKAFLSDQCKEIEENNRKGETRDLFKKIRDTKGTICQQIWKTQEWAQDWKRSAREFQKNIYFCFIDYAKAFDSVEHNKLENFERDGSTRPPDLPLEKPVCRSGSNS